MSSSNKDSFDVTPTKIELKGKPRGVSRLSTKARVAGALIVLVVFIMVVMASFAMWQSAPDPNAEPQRPAETEKPQEGKKTKANLQKAIEGMGDGQAIAVTGTGTDMATSAPLGTVPAPVPGAAPGTGVSAPLVGSTAPGTPGTPAPKPGAGGDLFGPAKTGMGRTGGSAGLRDKGPSSDDVDLSARSAREARVEQSLQQARQADMDVQWATNADRKDPAQAARDKVTDALSKITAAAQQGGANGQLIGGQGGQAQQDDQNKHLRKEAFLRSAESQPDKSVHPEIRRPAMSPYVICPGQVIPAALDSSVNTDLPGQMTAMVIQDVYDCRTGRYVLIPQGTRVVGTYDSQVAMGQKRILVAWSQLVFEDTSTLALKGMPGADTEGNAGFDANVDNHFGRVMMTAAALSLFSAGLQLSQPTNNAGTNTAPSVGQTIAASVGQQLNQVGMAYTQRQLQVQPTLTRENGYKFVIQVTSTIVFKGPYKPFARN